MSVKGMLADVEKIIRFAAEFTIEKENIGASRAMSDLRTVFLFKFQKAEFQDRWMIRKYFVSFRGSKKQSRETLVEAMSPPKFLRT